MPEEAESTAEIFIRMWSDVDHLEVVEAWWPNDVAFWDKRDLGGCRPRTPQIIWDQTILRGMLAETPRAQFSNTMDQVLSRLRSEHFAKLRDRPDSIGADIWVLFFCRSAASTLSIGHEFVRELAKHRMGIVMDICLTDP